MARNLVSSYTPSVSDQAVAAKTGRAWAEWFRVLDKEGALKLPHKKIAARLQQRHGLPGWWAQMVTVEYERARGLRAVNQKADGFSVSVSKTIPAEAALLYEAAAGAAPRKRWFPEGSFEITTRTPARTIRGRWKRDARMHLAFARKGKDKAQVTVQIDKLADKSAVERERRAWKRALDKLAASAAK